MKRISTLLAGALVLTATSSWALSLGTNITIWDGKGVGETLQGGGEDDEVEPGMVDTQVWDLEAFLFDGTHLSVVGGYNFMLGEDSMRSGDIFLDIDGTYGELDSYGGHAVANTSGYEYVMVLPDSWETGSNQYEVFALSESSMVFTVSVAANASGIPGSNPWRYANGGTENLGAGGQFNFASGLGDSDLDGQTFQGDTTASGTHYAIYGFDLSFLLADPNYTPSLGFTTHFTMECGNDNLMGRSSVVPEPATLLLLGTGLTGLAGIARRRTGRKD